MDSFFREKQKKTVKDEYDIEIEQRTAKKGRKTAAEK